jgi:hypothetical protein
MSVRQPGVLGEQRLQRGDIAGVDRLHSGDHEWILRSQQHAADSRASYRALAEAVTP